MFTMRFDMRVPGTSAASATQLYQAAFEMAEWGEANGCLMAVVSEHHGSSDGYLPSPLVFAAALAGRTRKLKIQIAALIVPLHDPIRLAEDMAVLDIASAGRVSYVVAVGYRAEEYAMFGRELKARGRRMDESLETLRRAWTGEPFDYQGRPVRVTPVPATPGGPSLLMGGNSQAAVRRAARFGLGFLAQGGDESLRELYADQCKEHGNEPGLCIIPAAGVPTSAFIAEDPERAWAELGPYLLHDARMYAEWLGSAESASLSKAATIESLRAEQGAYRIYTPDEAIAAVASQGLLMLHPLCGGLPPELAFETLELLAAKVLPAQTTS
jgi:alkanesulfonate monooxygenase SsuD/methylene tetrahydromethanopterin reductase-like flavin-dependent oxidoreductase (luciferase family)